MKNTHLKIYLLTLGILALVIIDTPVADRVMRLIGDEARLTFHYSNNNVVDTSIVIINMEYLPLDTIRRWTKRIIDLKPRVLVIDNFSDSVEKVDRIDGTIILPIISEDGRHFDYSTNNFTKRQVHGVALVDDYFKLKKFYDTDSTSLPSMALQIIKDYDPIKYAEIIEGDNEEIVNYIPTKSFTILDFIDLYPDDYLKGLIKDKIVIIGYTGYSKNHLPDILDNNDSHLTPIGKIYGPIIIANQIHTLMGDRMKEPGRFLMTVVSVAILVASFFMVIRLRTNNRLFITIGVNVLLIILLWTIALLSMLLTEKYDIFVSIELISLALLMGLQSGIVYKLVRC